MSYRVRPVKAVEIRQYTYRAADGKQYSGTFTITFRCYDPFGMMLRSTYTGMPDREELATTGILPVGMMPPAPELTSQRFHLYNCGTERAHTRILLAGEVGDGLTIENATTGQVCRIAGLHEG